jgi:hypothetical protein
MRPLRAIRRFGAGLGGAARLAGLLPLLAAPVQAQLHPLPPGPRPLHARLEQASVVAIGTVAAVDEGRIGIRDATALRGEPGSSFEVKRSPLAPPPLEPGTRAVLLLRGARSPYLLVDDPRELVVLGDDDAVVTWERALLALLDAADDPGALLGLYVDWLTSGPESLRTAAVQALPDPRAPFLPIDSEAARALVRVALDARATPAARRAATLVATRSPDGRKALVRAVPERAERPELVAIALQAGAAARTPGEAEAIGRALADPDPDVRRAALGAALFAWSDDLAEQVAALAARDPVPMVRRDATQVLGQRAAGRSAADPAGALSDTPGGQAGARASGPD